jgi:Flp pilus assembly protein TadG
MLLKHSTKPSRRRKAVATAELAILLPVLVTLFVGVVDFARVFYYAMTVTNCARNGALWLCDPVNATQSQYTTLQQAATADAPNLSPTPNVTSTNGTDANGEPYVEVTVTYDFKTVSGFPLFPSPFTLTKTVRMRTIQLIPNFP